MTFTNPSELERLADVALLVVYGAVSSFFCWRYLAPDGGRVASLGIALMPSGWFVVACWDLGVWHPHPLGLVRWAGVAFGVFLLTSVMRNERAAQHPHGVKRVPKQRKDDGTA
jgi:hypothetical protein